MVEETVAEEDRQFYVYVVFRRDGTPCYVGKGHRARWRAHLKCSHNPYLRRIAAKEGHSLPIVKVRERLSEATAFEIEAALIAAIGRHDLGTGPLANLTSGGDGVCGHIRTPKQRAAMSAARKGHALSREAAAKVSASLAGRPKTPEHGAAISAAKKGKPGKTPSAETRAKMSAAQYARWTPELRIAHGALMHQVNIGLSAATQARKSARITAALTGKKLSAEHRANIGNVQRGKKRGPMSAKQRILLSEIFRGMDRSPRTPESKANRKATWAAKRSAKMAFQIELPLAD